MSQDRHLQGERHGVEFGTEGQRFLFKSCCSGPMLPPLCETDNRKQGVASQVCWAPQVRSARCERGTADGEHLMMRELMRIQPDDRTRGETDIYIDT